ncbi:hypothetical protein BRADI_1g35290v3 [Brachypodium distachyon]|uniref:Uncharacterized protein n=1 Tax=Brachypodium distachyon TaxID=15368 RepID=I1GX25_BRADI|nr:hypothetical protein BRADI_1g35290v3 [Brachypodium distachyon]
MAAKLRALLVVACLVLATAAAVSGTRPLTAVSEEEGDGARAVKSPPATADVIQTMVGAVEGAGHKLFIGVDMLRGIKNSGPSPGDGH